MVVTQCHGLLNIYVPSHTSTFGSFSTVNTVNTNISIQFSKCIRKHWTSHLLIITIKHISTLFDAANIYLQRKQLSGCDQAALDDSVLLFSLRLCRCYFICSIALWLEKIDAINLTLAWRNWVAFSRAERPAVFYQSRVFFSPCGPKHLFFY